ncbi:MAG TPA: hypothetical protein VE783_08415, partial [Candidatus Limnocylindrales bacterium]|nr:hypothetical protein [Candidatus Limnocylindrales bacterium]
MKCQTVFGVALLALCVVVSPMFAATPSTGTLNAPAAGSTSSIVWTGGPFTGATADPSVCTSV